MIRDIGDEERVMIGGGEGGGIENNIFFYLFLVAYKVKGTQINLRKKCFFFLFERSKNFNPKP